MQSSMAQTTQSRRFNGKVIGSIILVLVGLILAGVALTGIWWTVTTPGGATDFYLDKGCSPQPTGCLTYAQWTSQYSQTKPAQDTFGTIDMILIVGLILAVLTLILVFVAAGKPGLKIDVLLVGVIAAIVLLGAVLYAYTALPPALNDMTPGAPFSSFFGSADVGGIPETWGGGMGWFLTLASFVLVLIGTIVAFVGIKKPAGFAAPPA